MSASFPSDSCADIKRKIADDVWLLSYRSLKKPIPVHICEGCDWFKVMKYRENFDGPVYWCEGCGYVLPEGLAMAIRVNELEL